MSSYASSALGDQNDDDDLGAPLLPSSLVLNQAMDTVVNKQYTTGPCTGNADASSSSSSASASDGSVRSGGSERYCADLVGCIQFFRSTDSGDVHSAQAAHAVHDAAHHRSGNSTSTLPSLQNQMQASIRIQAWWRKQLAVQHYQTMKVCRQLLQQLRFQPSNTCGGALGGTAYQELQQALSALQVKTQHQLHLQEQQLLSLSLLNTGRTCTTNANVNASDTPTSKTTASPAADSGEEKKEDYLPRQPALSEDEDEEDDASRLSEDPVWIQMMHHRNKNPQPPNANGNHRQRQRPRQPTKEMLALDTIYALQLALDNTAPEDNSHAIFSRQELLEPHETVLLQEQEQQQRLQQIKNVGPLVQHEESDDQEDTSVQTDGGQDHILVERSIERQEPETTFFPLQSQALGPDEEAATTSLFNGPSRESLHEKDEEYNDQNSTSSHSVSDYDHSVSEEEEEEEGPPPTTSPAFSVLRFFGFVQDKVIEEEVYHNDNVYHDIIPNNHAQESDTGITELLDTSTGNGNVQSTMPSITLSSLPTLYSQDEAQAAKEIQQWWRQCVAQREFETLRVCSVILQTVQFASQASPVTMSRLSTPAAASNMNHTGNHKSADLYPQLQHAIQWLQAKEYRQAAVRNYLKNSIQREVACQKIQKWYRKYAPRNNLEFQRQERLAAQQEEYGRDLAASTIQAWWRGLDLEMNVKQRAAFQEMRQEDHKVQHNELDQSAVVLQAWWRHRHTQKILADLGRVGTSQGYTKGHSQRVQFGEEMLVEALPDDVSSIASSTGERGFGVCCNGRQHAYSSDSSVGTDAIENEMAETVRNESATKLQKWYRQISAVHRYRTLVKSSQMIQGLWRAQVRRRSTRTNLSVMLAAVRIQGSYRAHCYRRNARLRRRATLAVVLLQAVFRGGAVREELRRTKLGVPAVLRLQAHYRRQLAQRECNGRRALTHLQNAPIQWTMLQGLVQFQAHFRRRQYHLVYIHLQHKWKYQQQLLQRVQRHVARQRNVVHAAIVLQAHFRRQVASREVGRERNGRSAIIRLQAHARRRSSQIKVSQHLAVVQGIVQFQAHVRRFQHQAKYKYKLLQVQEDPQQKSVLAVILLQAHLRRKLVQREISRRLTGERALIRLQAHARRRLAEEQVSHYRLVLQGIVNFQAHFRRRQLSLVQILLQHKRKHQRRLLQQVQGDLLWVNHAATIIQSGFRKKMSRTYYRQVQAATILLQSLWRQLRQCRLYRYQQMSIVRLQSYARRRAGQRMICLLREKQQASIHIQSVLRGFMTRRNVEQLKSSAVSIQSLWRSYYTQMRYQNQCDSCIVIQGVVRQHLARLRSTHMARLRKERAELIRMHQLGATATALQAFWRGYSCRNEMEKCKAFASTIQASWRGYVARTAYLAQRNSSIVLQSFVRRRLSLQRCELFKQQQHYEAQMWHELKAALLIQKICRGFVARRQYKHRVWSILVLQPWIRGCQTRRRLEQYRKASVVLQAWERRRRSMSIYTIMKTQRNAQLRQEMATCQIQGMFRGYIVRLERRQLHASATTIQCCWRRWRASSTFKKYHHSCVKIQSLVRKRASAVTFKNLLAEEMERSSAALLKAWWRKQYKQRLYREEAATIVLQSAFRSYLARQRVQLMKQVICQAQAIVRSMLARQHFMRYRIGCIMIQSVARRFLGVSNFALYRSSAILVQCYLRRWASHQAFHKKRLACIKLQVLAQRFLAEKKCHQSWSSAVLLQATFRGWTSHQAYQEKRLACIKLQVLTRRVLAEKRYHQALSSSAVLLQATFRGWTSHQAYQKKRLACIKLQVLTRRVLAEKRYRQACSSAVLLQAVFRGCTSYQAYQEKRLACIRLQVLTRRVLAEKRYRQARSSAILLQAAFRRVTFLRWYCSARLAAQHLQSLVRRNIAVRQHTLAKSAVLQLQKVWRKKAAETYLAAAITSATTLQRIYRGSLTRSVTKGRVRATILIQRLWRDYHTANIAHRQREGIFTQIVVIQSFWRMSHHRQTYSRLGRACLLLQSVARQTIARHNFLMLQASAVLIQVTWRAHRKSVLTAASGIQKLYRGAVARKVLHDSKQGAMKIQCIFRGYLARRHLHCESFAARIIQCAWRRASWQRKCHWASTQLQRQARAQLALRSYKMKKSSAVKIQAACRMLQDRSMFMDARIRCILIQSVIRRALARRSCDRLRLAVIFLQSTYRKRKTITAYLQQRSAILAIQRCERNWVGLGRRRRLQEACALRIQSQWRMIVDRRSLAYLKQKTVRAQSVIRAWRAREMAMREKKSIVSIQAWLRGRAARESVKTMMLRSQSATIISRLIRRYLQQRQASILLQSKIRQRLAHADFLTKKQAIVTIQCFWRVTCAKSLSDCVVKNRAASLIQRNIRAVTTRLRVESATFKWETKEQACTLIQSKIRQYLVYRNHVVEREAKWQACILIQSKIRQYLVYKKDVVGKSQHAMVIIQSKIRQYLVHRNHVGEKETKRQACTLIQSKIRQYLVYRNHVVEKETKGEASTLIQSKIRQYLVYKNQVVEKEAKWQACTLIQSKIRQYLVYRTDVVGKSRHAAVIIQSKIRQYLVYKNHVAEKEAKWQACTLIQSKIRQYLVYRKDVVGKSRQAVVIIQSKIRQYLVYRKDAVGKSRHAVVIIQSKIRQYLVYRNYVVEKEAKRQACTIIQSKIRQYFVCREDVIGKRQCAVVVIQSKIRQYLVYRYRKDVVGKRRHAAVIIQRAWNGFVDRAVLSLFQFEATILQAHIRMSLARRRFQRYKWAAAIIASSVRRKKATCGRSQAIIAIQSFARILRSKQVLNRLRMTDAIRRKRPLLDELSCHHTERVYQNVSSVAEREVKQMLAGDLPTLESVGICLSRLGNHVTQFRFLVQTEESELGGALETFRHVQEHCAAGRAR